MSTRTSQPTNNSHQSSEPVLVLKKEEVQKSKRRLYIILAIIAILTIITSILLLINRSSDNDQIQTNVREVIDPNTLENQDKRAIDLAVAKGHLDYLTQQKDQRGAYLDYAGNAFCPEGGETCSYISSNRAFLSVLWARYQYYLLTHDETELQILKDDIKQSQTAILDGYLEDGSRNVIQNNSLNCYLMQPMINDENNIFTDWEKDTLKRFCTESMYEWLPQEEITFLLQEDLTKQDEVLPSGAVTKDILLAEINSKIETINNNQITNYNLEDDAVFQNLEKTVRNNLTEDQLIYFEEFLRDSTKGYYYFAFDQLARYQLDPTVNNEYLSLVLINDFLSVYIYNQQQTTPLYTLDLDNCFITSLIESARKILPEGQEITVLQPITYKPNFDIGIALNDDLNRQPTLSCWLIAFNDNKIDTTENQQFQDAVFKYFGNEKMSSNIIKSSLLTGLLSQSLRR